jgi:hypothetical protein
MHFKTTAVRINRDEAEIAQRNHIVLKPYPITITFFVLPLDPRLTLSTAKNLFQTPPS